MGHYEYIVTKEGRPLRLHMLGGELALESHFDEYVLDFLSFEALDAEDEAPFTLPKSCADLDGARAGRPVSLVLAALVPGTAGVRVMLQTARHVAAHRCRCMPVMQT